MVGGAARDDGTGYYQVDAAGDVAAFGAATCYGGLPVPTSTSRSLVWPSTATPVATGWSPQTVASSLSMLPYLGSMEGPDSQQADRRDDRHPQWGRATGLSLRMEGCSPSMRRSKVRPGASASTSRSWGMGLDRATGGYWLVASDGGVFSYNVPFFGSTGSPSSLNKPVVGIAPVSDGSGYRLTASDGGVFSYNAPFYGSAGSITLNKPVVGGINNNSYDGYWLLASDGGVFTYSPTNEGMPFFGSARSHIHQQSVPHRT